MKNKKVLIAVIAIIGIVLTTIGVTVAWFSYSRNGVKENTIKSGNITFHYQESDTIIDIDDMMPMTDDQGKAQDDYFEFDITSKTSRTLDIPYYITVRRTADSFADLDSVIKVYLTKVNNGVESQVALSKFSLLNHYENSEINIPLTEKALYNDTVLAGSSNYTQKYRLRMWVDYDANYLVQNGDENTYPLNNKKYALTVNVYGTGNEVSESTVELRKSTAIETLTLGNDEVTSDDGTNYQAIYALPEGETTLTKTITVDTESSDATVTVERLTAANIEASKIKRISTQLQLSLTKGANDYRITVTPLDKTVQPKVYNLSILVAGTAQSFSADDWVTIAAELRNNPNTNVYSVGDTKTIDLGNLGSHTVRLANTTACTTQTSTTGCGIVIEFADVISKQKMNATSTNIGGYPGTNVMYDYVTGTVYNALPSELKSVMIYSTVVSSHGSNITNPNNSELDNKNNFVTPNQKIYLLDSQEVFGDNFSYNTARNTTRQLDYYSTVCTEQSCKVKTIEENNTNNPCYWWLRTADQRNTNIFLAVVSNGTSGSYTAGTAYGVSPAFRIG